jgi:ribosomal protein L37AE/L43A
MASEADLGFGKIALAKGFCTQQQIDECLQMQAMSEDAPSLGELLLYKSFLTPEQHAQIEKELKRDPPKPDRAPAGQEESVLFGKLAVQEGLLLPEVVEKCLRDKSAPGETRSLGEILVARGFLTQTQVRQLLAKQQKKIMSCPVCRLSFTVHTRSQAKVIQCPRCKGPLQEGKPSASVRTDAEFATTVLRMSRPAPAAPEKTPRSSAPQAPAVRVTCVVCDDVFQSEVDPNGRVRCPSCNATFSPRG